MAPRTKILLVSALLAAGLATPGRSQGEVDRRPVPGTDFVQIRFTDGRSTLVHRSSSVAASTAVDALRSRRLDVLDRIRELDRKIDARERFIAETRTDLPQHRANLDTVRNEPVRKLVGAGLESISLAADETVGALRSRTGPVGAAIGVGYDAAKAGIAATTRGPAAGVGRVAKSGLKREAGLTLPGGQAKYPTAKKLNTLDSWATRLSRGQDIGQDVAEAIDGFARRAPEGSPSVLDRLLEREESRLADQYREREVLREEDRTLARELEEQAGGGPGRTGPPREPGPGPDGPGPEPGPGPGGDEGGALDPADAPPRPPVPDGEGSTPRDPADHPHGAGAPGEDPFPIAEETRTAPGSGVIGLDFDEREIHFANEEDRRAFYGGQAPPETLQFGDAPREPPPAWKEFVGGRRVDPYAGEPEPDEPDLDGLSREDLDSLEGTYERGSTGDPRIDREIQKAIDYLRRKSNDWYQKKIDAIDVPSSVFDLESHMRSGDFATDKETLERERDIALREKRKLQFRQLESAKTIQRAHESLNRHVAEMRQRQITPEVRQWIERTNRLMGQLRARGGRASPGLIRQLEQQIVRGQQLGLVPDFLWEAYQKR